MAKRSFKWKFFRAGGVDQVALASGEDIAALGELDQKLWVALACPTKGTEIDEKTVACIDGDKDGRVRVPEVLAAIDWCGKVFKSLDILVEKGTAVPLVALDGSTPEGKAVLASAKRILRDQDKKDQKEITLDDVLAMEKVFLATRFNGDGIVPAESADDDDTKKAIGDVIAAVGSVVDRSGKPGVDKALVTGFFKEAEAMLAWDTEGAAEAVRPLGDATVAAAEALAAVEAKVNDWLARCRLAAFDGRASTALGISEKDLDALTARVLTQGDEEVAKLPLARVEAGRPLPLEAGLNPAWSERIGAFAKAAVEPLLGARSALDAQGFATVVDKLAACRAWLGKKPTGKVAALGVARLRELVDGDVQSTILDLIEQDAALEAEYAQIASVEKAVRLRRDMFRLLRNFASFADFYGRKGASFQAGTLYLDGRACDLTVYVNDAAKHAALAALSKAYLAYCECTRPAGEKTHIVAAFTAGDVDALMVGRNGLFYDRKGRDWDATITQIIENPISIRQAFWSPYKRLVRMIEEQVAKRAADKEKESMGKVDAAAGAAVSAAHPPPAAAPAPGAPPPAPGAPAPAPAAAAVPPPKKIDVGTVAAIGVAVAGVATFLSSILATFLGMGMWLPLGLLALLLAISGPSMLIAFLKLRQRNLGPILDANGWAINARVKINVPFGGSLTSVAKLPPGASRTNDDPYAEKRRPWWLYITLLVLLVLGIAWVLGWLDGYFPSWAEKAKSSSVFGRPAASAAPSSAPTGEPTAAPSAPAPK
ncbi:MAG: hypothetical protein HY908_03465 [Myxococcales bacterium]|nr:hypothetical protein [Myxococcales bacterium]